MPVSWISAGAGLLGAAGNLFGGGGGGGTSGGSGYYIPTGLSTADQQWQDFQKGNYNVYGSNSDMLQKLNALSLNQGMAAGAGYAPNFQAGANAAGGSYGNLANFYNAQASGNINNQNALLAAGQQTYQTALDPQNALYNRTAQQLQDQTGATNSMYGLGSSGAGAGVANQAMSNFNIDWQNNQLQRQMQGLQAYGQAAGQAGQYGQLATQQAGMAPGAYLASGQVPYDVSQQIAGLPQQLANNYGQFLNQNLYAPSQSIQGNALNYMKYGQQSQAVPYPFQQQGAQNLGSSISSAVGGLGNSLQNSNAFQNFGNATGSFSGGDFSGAFTNSPYFSGSNSYGFTM